MSSEVAVLIGTGSIGLAIGRIAATGRTFLLADINESQLESTAELLRNEGYEVVTQVTDVSNNESVVALAKRAASLGTVARLIHAAGVSPNQASPEKIVHVDLMGTAYVLDAFGEVIGKGGSGVVIGSQAGHMGERLPLELEHELAYSEPSKIAELPAIKEISNTTVAYIVAKRANSLRVQGAAMLWSKRGARVNCISPGMISTPLARDEMTGPNAKGYKHMMESSPAARLGTPSEVGQLAAFLLDERGAFITGADFLNDGGVIAAMKAGVIKF